PTESRSRFSASAMVARPSASAGSSIISPCITSARPWMRTMPSDTEVTVPSLRASAASATFSMRVLISSLISDGLSVVVAILVSLVPALPPAGFKKVFTNELVRQRRVQARQLALDRAVDDDVGGRDQRAADQAFVDRRLD